MRLIRDEIYQKKEQKFFKKHRSLIDKYAETLKKLQSNPFDLSLKTHKLKGTLKGLYACSLSYEYRIICIILIQDEEIVLVDIGTHDEVY